MRGALINGYTHIEDDHTGQYLDEPPMWEFWERASKLDTPIYLHPREPLPAQIGNYKNYASLVGSAWGFGHETATHVVRLMLSGLFDQNPGLIVILGHLGEGLPFLLPRLQHRLYKQRHGAGLGQAKKTVSEYFQENFYITTSGHFHTKALIDSIEEIGVDRVMFSVDSPYEDVEEGGNWFDNADMSDNDREKIGRENASGFLIYRGLAG
ncbi:amidohydrolase family protein [Microbulbifer spongiae]|uniref:Amidohydrolase family protein n=1 Tax=Microbulbifer spongiae TaxID=2944933 RepID=A0ABY9EG38_9GAMM|nr:amidohydrolase family protein [Microbulbifer sp. MI-G]WKD51657.1 amidohydrolase family protein [Microbulbifer sp. MI-G]